MLNMNNEMPNEVVEMFQVYSASELIEHLEMLDLMLVNEGMRRKMDVDFEKRYAITLFFLKRTINALGSSITDINEN